MEEDKLAKLKSILEQDWGTAWVISHTPPDVDSLSSMMLMNILLRDLEVEYSYKNVIDTDMITKPNQKKFLKKFRKNLNNIINIQTFREELNQENDLFIIVDAQYGEGNTTPMSDLVKKNIIVIDHHVKSKKVFDSVEILYEDINPEKCSCASLLHDYVKDILDSDIANIVYNGMRNDTNNFKKEIHANESYLKYCLESGLPYRNPIDWDIIHELNRETFSQEDKLQLIKALSGYEQIKNVALSEVDICDVNVLGHLADNLSEIEGNDIVICYFRNLEKDITRLSVRSYDVYIDALEWIHHLTQNVGSGGGHLKASAGFLDNKKIKSLYNLDVRDYLENRINSAVNHYERFSYGEVNVDNVIEGCVPAVKKEYLVRVIDLKECFCDPIPRIKVDTLEGTIFIYARYLVVGVKGEIYPVKNLKGYKKYSGDFNDDLYLFDIDELGDDYELNLTAIFLNKNVKISKNALKKYPIYKSNSGNRIWVKELDAPTKVVSKWDSNPLSGDKGDMLALNGDDIYIIDRDIFKMTYTIEGR